MTGDPGFKNLRKVVVGMDEVEWGCFLLVP
jgi:hypothetical protein